MEYRAVVVTGPTSSSKTMISIALASALDSEIISLDASQVYTDLEIGTGVPTENELRLVKHHLVKVYPPAVRVNAGRISESAFSITASLNKRGVIPIVVGSTWLYLKFYLYGCIQNFEDIENLNPDFELLRSLDPEYASIINPHDHYRIKRALSYILQTKKKYSDAHKQHNFSDLRVCPLAIALIWDRKKLHSRIQERCYRMLQSGLIEETKKSLSLYGSDAWGFKKSIGYKYFQQFLNKKLSLEEALSRMIKDTKRYAKQQLSYIRLEPQKRGWKSLPTEKDLDVSLKRQSNYCIRCLCFNFSQLLRFIRDFDFKAPTILYLDAEVLVKELESYYPDNLASFLKKHENSTKSARL